MTVAAPPFDKRMLAREILRGEGGHWAWPDDASAAAAFLEEAQYQHIEGLLAYRLHETGWSGSWPVALRHQLESQLRLDTLREALMQRELRVAFAALEHAGVPGLLMKGSALAYTVYPEPALRRRGDTDLMIRRTDRDRCIAALDAAGFRLQNMLEGDRVSHQMLVRKVDRHGIVHDLDVHWKISNRPAFEDVLTWDDMEALAVPVPALGPHGRALSTMHALILACVHPVAHHGAKSPARIRWVYDVHLLANAMTPADFDRWIALVQSKQIRAICARPLQVAREQFGTRVPPHVDDALRTSVEEPTAMYLSSAPWHGDVRLSDLRTSRGLRSKLQLVREVVFPPPSYIRREYGVANPGLIGFYYLYRIGRGCWRLWQRMRFDPTAFEKERDACVNR